IGTLSLGFSARLNMRFGARATLVPGLALIALGLALFARAPVGGSYFSDVLPVMILLGTGAGLCFPSLMPLAMSGATRRDAGPAVPWCPGGVGRWAAPPGPSPLQHRRRVLELLLLLRVARQASRRVGIGLVKCLVLEQGRDERVEV